MTTFLIILVALALLVALVVLLAGRKPDRFEVKRSLLMKAPPEKIQQYVVDYRKWMEWSPYEGVTGDGLKREYSGAESGVGAKYAWEGAKTGKGNMAITEVTPGKILMDLHFDKPMKADNAAWFTFEPSGDTTTVTWGVNGTNSFMAKVACLFMDMDKLIGKDFAKGLEKLKTVVER